jgi:hypothetical protein
MPLDDAALLAALRDPRPIDAICRAAGVSPEEFRSARDAWLARHAILGDRTLAGPVAGTVEILRDPAGVPHIHAASTTDLYFGLGFAMAQDRLWQMDRLRRRALGRQAEILGPAYAAADAAHLTIGLDEICTREAAAIDPSTRIVVEAMVAGINRFIETAGDDLPVEFDLLDYRPRGRHRARFLVVAEWPDRPAFRGRMRPLLSRAVAHALPDPRGVGERHPARPRRQSHPSRLWHRRRDRQQQLGARRQPYRHRPTDRLRRPASAVLGALVMVRIRPAWARG